MKKIFLFIFIVLSMSVFVACNKVSIGSEIDVEEGSDKGPDKGAEEAEYTVMFYGVGGENLDAALYVNLINEVEQSLSSKKLNFVGLAKFSKRFQVPTQTSTKFKKNSDGEDELVSIADSLKGTIYVTKTYQGFKVQNYAKADLSFYKSETLSNFINKAVKEYPAKKYVLTFWDHGSTFDENDILTKSMLSDDNIQSPSIASIHDIIKGIQNSSIGRVSMIYSDMCLTNTIETLYQFSTVADYYMGSANVAPGEGGNYIILLNKLINGNDLVTDCKSFIEENVKIWDKQNKQLRLYQDMVISDLRKINPVVESFKRVSDRYIELYQANKAIKTKLDTMQLNGFKEIKFSTAIQTEDETTGEAMSSQHIYKWTNPGKFYFYDTQYSYRSNPVYTENEPATLLNNLDIQSNPSIRNDWYTSTDLYASFATMNKEFEDDELTTLLGEFEAAIKAMIVHRVEIYVPKLWDGMYHATIGLKWVNNRRANGFNLGDEDQSKGAKLMDVYPMSTFGQVTNWHRYFNIYKVDITKELQIDNFDDENTEPVFSEENI